MEFIKNNIVEFASLSFSVVALVISSGIAIKGWWMHRNIYGVDLCEINSSITVDPMFRTSEINKKLSSGNYTIMHTEKTASGYNILIGKIKK
jgi:hypothetical protein